MRQPDRLFYGIPDSNLTHIQIPEDEQHHIKNVLRIKEGDCVHFTDGKGLLAEAEIHYAGKKTVAHILAHKIQDYPFSRKLHLLIAPTKNIDRTEFFLEKAVELGVHKVSFFFCERSERKNLNLDKMQKKMIAAAKQSRRYYFPEIQLAATLAEALPDPAEGEILAAHCDEGFTRKALQDFTAIKNLQIFVGPEGDFSPGELQLLQKHACGISLGIQRLRTETAGVYLAAWNYSLMDFD